MLHYVVLVSSIQAYWTYALDEVLAKDVHRVSVSLPKKRAGEPMWKQLQQ